MKSIRIVSTFLAFLILLTCLSGCGKNKQPNDSQTSITTSTTADSMSASPDTSDDPIASADSSTVDTASSDIPSPDSTTVATDAADHTTKKGDVTTSRPDTKTTSTAKPKPAATTTTKSATTTKSTSGSKPSGSTSTVKPVSLKALSSSEYYGYQYLKKQGGSLAAAYERIAAGSANLQTEITLKDAGITLSEKELKSVMQCYHADYPQHFWYAGSYTYMLDGSKTAVSVELSYTMNTTQQQAAQKKVDAVVKELLAKAAYGQTVYERELILHDALASRVTYIEATHAHDLYGALVEGKAVCEGYARAFQYLLYQAGTQCLLVEGSSVRPGGSRGEAHAWNLVEINGKYYHVDVTWDDQTGAAVPIMHAFFNLNDALILEDHTISSDNAYPIPTCSSTTESYFVKEGTEVKSFTVDKIADLFIKGNGTATIYVSKNTVNEFVTWFQKQSNLSAISTKANLNGKSFALQSCGHEIIIMTE